MSAPQVVFCRHLLGAWSEPLRLAVVTSLRLSSQPTLNWEADHPLPTRSLNSRVLPVRQPRLLRRCGLTPEPILPACPRCHQPDVSMTTVTQVTVLYYCLNCRKTFTVKQGPAKPQ